MNLKFESHKLEVQLKRSGTMFRLLRQAKNEFGELSGEYFVAGGIVGLYYSSAGTGAMSTITTSDISSSRYKPNTGFVCLASEARRIELKPYDILQAHDRYYRIQALNDVNDFGYAYDVSIEVVDSGIKARLE